MNEWMNKRSTNDSTPYSHLWFKGESLHPRTVGLGVAITERYQWLSKTNIRCTCWRMSVRACSSSGAKGPRDRGCGKLLHPEQKLFIGIRYSFDWQNVFRTLFFIPHASRASSSLTQQQNVWFRHCAFAITPSLITTSVLDVLIIFWLQTTPLT